MAEPGDHPLMRWRRRWTRIRHPGNSGGDASGAGLLQHQPGLYRCRKEAQQAKRGPRQRTEGTAGPKARLDLEGAGGPRKRRELRQLTACRSPHGTYNRAPGSLGRGKRAGARPSPQNAAIDWTPSRLCMGGGGGWLPIPKAALHASPPALKGACASGSHPFPVRA